MPHNCSRVQRHRELENDLLRYKDLPPRAMVFLFYQHPTWENFHWFAFWETHSKHVCHNFHVLFPKQLFNLFWVSGPLPLVLWVYHQLWALESLLVMLRGFHVCSTGHRTEITHIQNKSFRWSFWCFSSQEHEKDTHFFSLERYLSLDGELWVTFVLPLSKFLL